MFDIEYKGANSIIINTKKAKLVVDPKLSLFGLEDQKTSNAIELLTEARFEVKNDDTVLTINGPGEYGVADFDIKGIPVMRHIDKPGDGLNSTIYRIDVGETRIGVIGNIDENLSEEQLEALGVIDILILPVGGGGYTLDAVSAAKVIKLVDPKVVVPVHYADKSIKYDVQQDELQLFIDELSVTVENVDVYKYKQQPWVSGALSVVVINRS